MKVSTKPLFRRLIGESLFENRVVSLVKRINLHLSSGDRILDLGAGTCLFTRHFQSQGYQVTPVDVTNRSYYPEIKPLIYDGKRLPFADNAFDACLLIGVLHHTPKPDAVLSEAARVSKKIFLHEDIYESLWQKYYTYFIDSLLNKQFFRHPHTNKNDRLWRQLFARLDLKLAHVDYYQDWGFIKNGDYFLIKH